MVATTPSSSVSLSPTIQKTAAAANARIRGEARNAILFVGTGVSKGMVKRGSDGGRLCDWTEFFRELGERLPDRCVEKKTLRELKAVGAKRTKNAKSSATHILGMGHLIRARLEETGKWDDAVAGLVDKVSSAYDSKAAWTKFFAQLGRSTASEKSLNMPLILTTNYDPLLEKALQARTLTNPDSGISPVSVVDSHGASKLERFPSEIGRHGFRLWPRDKNDEIPAYLEGVIDAPRLWELQQAGLLTPHDSFVHHVHGSARMPSTIVFDAADYERTILTYQWRQLAKQMKVPNRATIFLGVGEGMFDRHLSLMWRYLADDARLAPVVLRKSPLAYWLVEKGSRESMARLLKKKIDEGNVPKGAIRIVSSPGYDWMPKWTETALTDRLIS